MCPTYHPLSLLLPPLFHPPIFLTHSLPFDQPPPHGLEHRGKSMWDKKPPATALGGVHAPIEHEEEEGLRDEADEAAAAQEEEGGGGGTTEVTTKEEDFETSVHMRRGKAVEHGQPGHGDGSGGGGVGGGRVVLAVAGGDVRHSGYVHV
ncbi:Os04g0480050 [Oryza sativa Japonica Group]|uniref:Os04g0480050 protein n=1 Tax=Oryza sativa subsp. japonica TaxID=39947 RepID=A0A0P0WBL6_ORYSJ|nr:hypothetical protein EE612_023988 [Oryza sativa]BAS89727.1 Os04g0480050 [Oryza sativa Japonica Group]